jgi:hypothetical protein
MPTSRSPHRLAALVLSAITYIAKPCHAAGEDGAAFLDIPVGGAPSALGGAYTASANNAYAPVWNPAGLGQLNGHELAAQHLSYLESINYEYAGVVFALGERKGLGASIQYLGSGDMAGTDPNGQSTGDFSNHYAAYSLAYGQRIAGALSLGVTGKVIEAKLGDVRGTAIAADAGLLHQCSDRFRVGFRAANLGSRLRFIEREDTLPLSFHLGAEFDIHPQWQLSAELSQEARGETDGHAGIEWKPLGLLSVRSGYRTDTVEELSALAGFSAGVGIHFWNQEFAYAWLPYGDLGNTHSFSMVIRFGGAKDGRVLKKMEQAMDFYQTDPLGDL